MRRAWGDRARVRAAVAVIGIAAAASGAPMPGPARAVEPAGAEAEHTMPLGSPAERSALGQTESANLTGDDGPALGLSEGLRTFAALAFVLVLAVGGATLLKKVAKGRGGLLGALGPGGPSPSGLMEILGRYPVGSGQTLVLLRLDRRVLLLHQTTSRKGASMRTLAEVADADEVASILMKTREEETERVDNGFREAMRKLETDFSMFEAESQPSPQPTDVDDGQDQGTIRSRLSRWTAPAAAGNSL